MPLHLRPAPAYLLECYGRHLALVDERQTPLETLISIARREDTIHVGEYQKLTDREAELSRKGVIKCNKNGDWELIISPAAFAHLVRNPDSLVRDPSLEKVLHRDGRHLTRHRPLTDRKGERYYVFRMTYEQIRGD